MQPLFLEVDEVLEIHVDQIQRYGGSAGVRDIGLLESAVAMPRASFGGEFAHPTLFDMAAAYLFHIAGNHPFVDGNKRTALAAALVFLRLNRVRIAMREEEEYDVVIRAATGDLGKDGIAAYFRAHAGKPLRRKARRRGRMEEE
jgi:death-on-curing protein